MSSSPFHGIFSAFGQDQDESGPQQGEPAFNFKEAEEKTPPPAVEQKPALQKGQIAVDIYEQDGYYVVRAPIAGVKLSDLDIEVDEKILTIRGARSLDDKVPEDQYYLQECFWGEFSRSITLPCSIDPKKVRATFSKDSILKIIIPKEERVKIVRVHEG
ncbi:Hsp20/alpha crystallin family protein [Patescibacteria group bacterium]|nr:Hsp20/alpha crystallin family protein [Patescibacteria group bacterium]